MIKICFICHGNICRSPMAEFVMKQKVKELNLNNKFIIESRATSYEEEGNDMHNGTKKQLINHGIEFSNHKSKRLEQNEYNKFDYFICMDDNNVKNTLSILKDDKEHKVIKLLKDKNVRDPWYTGDFDETYEDIDVGTNRILNMFKVEF